MSQNNRAFRLRSPLTWAFGNRSFFFFFSFMRLFAQNLQLNESHDGELKDQLPLSCFDGPW